MKLLTELYQILLELREILDRHSYYGYWIDPQNQLNPVEDQGHTKWIVQNIQPSDQSLDKSGGSLYTFAFDNGFVRIQHQHPEELNVEGSANALKRVANIIKPSLSQDDLDTIHIDIIRPGTDKSYSHYTYHLPDDRAIAMHFFDNL